MWLQLNEASGNYVTKIGRSYHTVCPTPSYNSAFVLNGEKRSKKCVLNKLFIVKED